MGTRRDILNRAADLVEGDRNAQYGDPNQDFQRTATLWNTYLDGVLSRKAAELSDEDWEADGWLEGSLRNLIDPHDVGFMMVLLKISRSVHTPNKRDHYDDAAGYIACAGDCAVTRYDGWLEDQADPEEIDAQESLLLERQRLLEAYLKSSDEDEPTVMWDGEEKAEALPDTEWSDADLPNCSCRYCLEYSNTY